MGVEKGCWWLQLGLSTTSQLERSVCKPTIDLCTNKISSERELSSQETLLRPMQSKQALAEEISQGAETDPQPMSGYQQHLTSPSSRQEIFTRLCINRLLLFTSVFPYIVMLKEQAKELADNAENSGSIGWHGAANHKF